MPVTEAKRTMFSMPPDIHAALKSRALAESRSMVGVLRRLLVVPPAASAEPVGDQLPR